MHRRKQSDVLEVNDLSHVSLGSELHIEMLTENCLLSDFSAFSPDGRVQLQRPQAGPFATEDLASATILVSRKEVPPTHQSVSFPGPVVNSHSVFSTRPLFSSMGSQPAVLIEGHQWPSLQTQF